MEYLYSWKTRFFSYRHEIFRNGIKCGEIKVRTWSRIADCSLNGRQLIFRTKGFFRTDIFISQAESDGSMGSISINGWRSSATMIYNGKNYTFRFDNFFHTRWNLSSDMGIIVKYNSNSFSSKGELVSYSNDEVLILSGLVIRNYFNQRSAASASA